jgi:hypothetical protein
MRDLQGETGANQVLTWDNRVSVLPHLHTTNLGVRGSNPFGRAIKLLNYKIQGNAWGNNRRKSQSKRDHLVL